MSNSTHTIALFPLNLVAFPRENLNLHIFEPRYKQLFAECRDEGIHFGINLVKDGHIMETGTEMCLQSIEKTYATGEMDVRTLGLGLYRIKTFYPKAPDKLYACAEVEIRDFTTQGSDVMVAIKIKALLERLYINLSIKRALPTDMESFCTFDVAHYVGFMPQQEYDFLNIPDEDTRRETLLEHLNKLLPAVDQTELLKHRAAMNGHFKDLPPLSF